VSVEEHIKLFDRIAGIYGLFHQGQMRRYREIIRENADFMAVETGGKVLDVGCGTGAFAAAFRELGFEAVGIDGSSRMAVQAEKNGIPCTVADATHRLDFDDGEFDLVIASYVAHGVMKAERMCLYREMKRVSRNKVLFQDFSQSERGFSPLSVIGILERLEGSDYLNFRNNGLEEMEEAFGSVNIVSLNKRGSWYICDAAQ
jgi:ubiquinone/menaquinone biosynthesis C-methylase UbiE